MYLYISKKTNKHLTTDKIKIWYPLIYISYFCICKNKNVIIYCNQCILNIMYNTHYTATVQCTVYTVQSVLCSIVHYTMIPCKHITNACLLILVKQFPTRYV